MRKASISRVAEKPVYWTDSAVPAATSSATIGPKLRRGTMSTAGGIATPPTVPPAGAVWRSSGVPLPGWLKRKTCGSGRSGWFSPRWTTDRPLGDSGSGTTCSWKVSVTSSGFVVAPQVSHWFWPRMTNGTPAKPLPMTLMRSGGAFRWIS